MTALQFKPTHYPDVGDLDRGGHAAQHYDLVRPVEPIGLARREPQREEDRAPL
jgi:hypothetical protein